MRGRVLPIGGLKSKILAAHLSGARTVILPLKNQKDLIDIPDEIRKQIKLILVESMDQVLEHGLVRVPKRLTAKPAEVVDKTEPLERGVARGAGQAAPRFSGQRPATGDRSAQFVRHGTGGRRRRLIPPRRRGRWSTATTTRRWACRARPARPTSRRPSAS